MTNEQILEILTKREYKISEKQLQVIKNYDMNFAINSITPLHAAADTYDGEVLTAVLYKTKNINAQDNEGHTALHIAVYKGWLHGIRKLLQFHADMTIKNNKGRTPLELCKYIIEKDAPEGFEQIQDMLEHPEKALDNRKELNRAVADDDIEFAKKLLFEDKVNPNGYQFEQDIFPKYQNSLFFVESVEMAKLLIEAGADVNYTNRFNDTPLKIAKERHLDDISKLLIENGAK